MVYKNFTYLTCFFCAQKIQVEIKDEDLSEEEIEDVDDDDDDDDDVIPLPAPPSIKQKHTKKSKNLTKQPSVDRKEKNIKKVSNNGSSNSDKEVRCFVFSTAMANRAGHAVSKGMFGDLLVCTFILFEYVILLGQADLDILTRCVLSCTGVCHF